MMLVGVLVVVLGGRVEAAPDPEREYTCAEHRADHEREQKLHHGMDLGGWTGLPSADGPGGRGPCEGTNGALRERLNGRAA